MISTRLPHTEMVAIDERLAAACLATYSWRSSEWVYTEGSRRIAGFRRELNHIVSTEWTSASSCLALALSVTNAYYSCCVLAQSTWRIALLRRLDYRITAQVLWHRLQTDVQLELVLQYGMS